MAINPLTGLVDDHRTKDQRHEDMKVAFVKAFEESAKGSRLEKQEVEALAEATIAAIEAGNYRFN